MTQIHVNPFRPEMGDRRPLRKLANNYRAEYRQYQNGVELVKDTQTGVWIALESRMPTSMSAHQFPYASVADSRAAQQGGIHFVTGSMNHGLPADVLAMMDYHVYIPQFDDVPFLAPASALAVVLDRIFEAVANRAGVW